jgi:thiamine-monophosphate kinase
MEKRTEIGDLGEFGLIDRLSNKFSNTHATTWLGIGDDAAVIDAGKNYMVVTTDMLLEGVHFDLSYTPIQHLGYKAVAVNISDIAAMNAIPKQITVNIGLSNRFSLEAVEALYDGIKAACDEYNIDLIGGDTTSSRTGLVISVTAIGEVAKDKVALRKNAKEGDIICVSGDLGGAYLGLQVLEREKQVFLANPQMQPQLEAYDYVVKRQLKPQARMDIIYDLQDFDVVPTSMIDISDGLASELFHIAKNSKVGLSIYEDKLPIAKPAYDTAVEFKLDPVTSVLNGGEDYELLFTIKQGDYEKLKNHPDIAIIGHIKPASDKLTLITKGGNALPLQAQGWKHF